jgi:hypothetical protein
VPVSDWLPLDQVNIFVLQLDTSGFGAVADGLHDVSLEVEGPKRPVQPWSEPPYVADLYLERLLPNAEWETGLQMWWEELPHALPFARELKATYGNDDHRSLRVVDLQERMPFKDGPRGVGWMGTLVTGQVDSRGRFAFAEGGGRVGYLSPRKGLS